MNTTEKYNKLKEELTKTGRVAVAFSSGVDSSLLLKVAHDVLGENAIAITSRGCWFSDAEQKEAVEFCQREGIRHIIVEVNETEIDGFVDNPPDRCYRCKKALFSKMIEVASDNNITHILEGSNMDDIGDYRPGMRAIAELGIESPLKEVGLYKVEIRELSKELGLPTWDKPSFACLASRFVYGQNITREKLAMVEKAEEFLHGLGFIQMRVRIHGDMARIEVLPDEIERLAQKEIRNEISKELLGLGFSYVALDLIGYRTGSMNEVL